MNATKILTSLTGSFQQAREVKASTRHRTALNRKTITFQDFDDVGFTMQVGAGSFTRSWKQLSNFLEQTVAQGFGSKAENQARLGKRGKMGNHLGGFILGIVNQHIQANDSVVFATQSL
jgi:hypothetical protein